MVKEELLTVRDVMRILRLSRISVYRDISSGLLKATKIGGKRWRIRPKVLEDYIRDGSRSSTHSML